MDEEKMVLTLKDSEILDGKDDELENVKMAQHTRTKEVVELKRQGRQAGEYTGYDDDEFLAPGQAQTMLAKYSDTIDGKQDKSFRLGTNPLPPQLEPPTPTSSLDQAAILVPGTPSPDLAGRRTGQEVREWRERSKPQPDDPEHGGSRADWAPPAGGGGGGGHHHQHISARDLHLPTSLLSATHGPTTTFALPAEHQHHQHHGAGSEAALATPN
ncbi:hypothetical protein PCANC_27632 [Puccinia coronata f. sp. avenae]|uniref:Uncharacterized protein n=1 Tax=Puccinia coronata f. sp. avenae TaxID=200324 RepID=A0A2N5TJC7_9BASI|nr:hypothetical protein PCANC_27632 [Puccinia coronata f. sp. avenae]